MKKILATALAILVIVSFTACDGGIDRGNPDLTWDNLLSLIESKAWDGDLNFTQMTNEQYTALTDAGNNPNSEENRWNFPYRYGMQGSGYFKVVYFRSEDKMSLSLYQGTDGVWYANYKIEGTVDGNLYLLKNGEDAFAMETVKAGDDANLTFHEFEEKNSL